MLVALATRNVAFERQGDFEDWGLLGAILSSNIPLLRSWSRLFILFIKRFSHFPRKYPNNGCLNDPFQKVLWAKSRELLRKKALQSSFVIW